MNGARYQLLAGSALALDEHGGIGGRDPANEVEDIFHAGTGANHVVLEIDLRAQLLIFLA